MKRGFLLVATNFAVMLLLGVVINVLGLNRVLNENGINVTVLLLNSLVIGFGGAIFSLLISKMVAKWSTGARVLDNPQSADELWLVATVQRLAEKAGVAMPEVAIYEG